MDELRRTRVSSGDVELLQQGVRGWVLPRCRVHRHVLRGYVRFLGRMFGVLRGHTHLQRRERVLDAVVSSPFFTLYESSLSLLLLLLLLLLVVVLLLLLLSVCRYSDRSEAWGTDERASEFAEEAGLTHARNYHNWHWDAHDPDT